MIVACVDAGPTGGRVDFRFDGKLARIGWIELQRALNILEGAAYPRHHHVTRSELRSAVPRLKHPFHDSSGFANRLTDPYFGAKGRHGAELEYEAALRIAAEKSRPMKSESPSKLIDARIKELNDWRGKALARMRALIKQADPEVVEEWKWRGVPVWSHDGMICTGETYKDYVKLTFAKGAALKDSSRLFNASLDGNVRRAIDIREDDKIDEAAFKNLVRAAVALNLSKKK